MLIINDLRIVGKKIKMKNVSFKYKKSQPFRTRQPWSRGLPSGPFYFCRLRNVATGWHSNHSVAHALCILSVCIKTSLRKWCFLIIAPLIIPVKENSKCSARFFPHSGEKAGKSHREMRYICCKTSCFSNDIKSGLTHSGHIGLRHRKNKIKKGDFVFHDKK